MFYGHIAIWNMFCMYFMIKKITLEGFTGTGEAKYEGFSQEYFQKPLKSIKKTYFGHNSTQIARKPTIFCMWGFSGMANRTEMVPEPGKP